MASVTPPGLAYEIEHDEAHQRFTARVSGYLALLDYQLRPASRPRRMVITHTEVPEAIGGRGIAGELTRVALRWAREKKYKVEPACSYAQAFMARHEEFDDLLAG
ncbi:GNAT family N-acetyltransferase [Stenotrophomonas sp. C3(2023)]|uniref:GNAT family N-acetyltransferase n=1 Tax=Stenotrophomonas sp. C3(2023) TaxID=3080277 RepID=UPI00293CA7BF|nr:GNAT family N-acetyltransferase [Stenotrophomonas sp. C3(2023)]MDV3468321.1 GNAT family N-acetyltransferase [Stenotrophomonas sp. C3(2023)]